MTALAHRPPRTTQPGEARCLLRPNPRRRCLPLTLGAAAALFCAALPLLAQFTGCDALFAARAKLYDTPHHGVRIDGAGTEAVHSLQSVTEVGNSDGQEWISKSSGLPVRTMVMMDVGGGSAGSSRIVTNYDYANFQKPAGVP